MALNFPADTTQPYVDSTSGLKYIYNDAVGAWESAVQPPVIITNSAPAIDLDGFLWYDTVGAAVYIRFGSQWVLLTNPGGGGGGGGGGGSNLVTISDVPPDPAAAGQLWWNNNLGRLFVYYIDPSTDAQWLEASPNIDGVNSGGAFSGPNAPSGAVEGDLWYNTVTSILSVFHDGNWEETSSAVSGLVTLTANEPIHLTGTATDPVVNIRDASAAQKGAVRLATQAETNAGADTTVALSPGALESILQSSPEIYIKDATDADKGIVELATDAETVTGSSSSLAATPSGVAAALSASGSAVAVGTVILFSNGSSLPAGYLLCDGAAVSRTTYADLYAVTGDLYGAGDGSTTFNLPDMSGAIANLQYGAYCIKT